MIDIYDNKIKNINKIYEEITTLPYFYGEKDTPEDVPSGMSSEINKNHFCFQQLFNFCKKENILRDFKITRAYVNIFAPKEYCNFHVDKSYKTLLYYPNLTWDINEGGETKFLSDNNTLVSILPIPGRIIFFDSEIPHTATSFKNGHRFSIAMKFEPK